MEDKQPPDFTAAIEQENAEAREWCRQHKHEIPGAIPYDRYSESVQRAITRALQSANNLPSEADEKRNAVELGVESTRFDRTGRTFKELGNGDDGTEGPPLTKAIERLAGGRYAEDIEAFFRRRKGETCREIAESFYIRDGKTGLQVHPSPATVRKRIDRVETWFNCLAKEYGIKGEIKARFLFSLEQEIQQLNKDAQWSRLQSELRGKGSESGTTAGCAELIPQRGVWWETSDQPNLSQAKPRPKPSPDDEPKDEDDSPTWQRAKALAGGRCWASRLIPNGCFVLLPVRELASGDPEYQQLREQVERLRPASPKVEVPEIPSAPAPKVSRVQADALKKDRNRIAQAQALRNAQPKVLLTSKQARAKEAEAGLLVGSQEWSDFERTELYDIVDFLKDGWTIAAIAKALKTSTRTIENRIKMLRERALIATTKQHAN